MATWMVELTLWAGLSVFWRQGIPCVGMCEVVRQWLLWRWGPTVHNEMKFVQKNHYILSQWWRTMKRIRRLSLEFPFLSCHSIYHLLNRVMDQHHILSVLQQLMASFRWCQELAENSGHLLRCLSVSSCIIRVCAVEGCGSGSGTGPQGEAVIDISIYLSCLFISLSGTYSAGLPPCDSWRGQHPLVINNRPMKPVMDLCKSKSVLELPCKACLVTRTIPLQLYLITAARWMKLINIDKFNCLQIFQTLLYWARGWL